MGRLIKIQDKVPEVYYRQSRDFQYIGRLYDLVLNYSKLNTDLLYTLPLSENSDSKLTELMSMTLGFKSKHNYNLIQLTALCSAFIEILKGKGTAKAIITACDVLLHAEGIDEETEVIIPEDDPYNIEIYIPSSLSDTNLLKDLLNYILPAGVSCNLIKESRSYINSITSLGYQDSITNYTSESTKQRVKDSTLSIIPKVNDEGLKDNRAKDTPGLFINSSILRVNPDEKYDK